jgi:hypothetical protein
MQQFLKNIKKPAALFICLLFFILAGKAQDNVIAVLEKQFTQYQEKTLQEKLFVHTDKNFYVAGEILWFKIYNTDASFHMPLDMSKVAYVEIIDRNNKPLLQSKISVKKGNGNGSFYLPVNINSGKYKLRAYTSWMKNYSADYFFEKIITIINTRKTAAAEIKNAPQQLSVSFFPEGGNLVNNIQSKLAFKITDENGKGVDAAAGIITNENNDTIIKFSPLKFGMGSFDFTPSAEHHYKATVTAADGSVSIAGLPVINKEGYVMHLAAGANNQLSINVKASNSPAGQLYLLVHTRQSVKVVAGAILQNGNAGFIISKNKLGDGISCFTLFDSNKQPLCERLYFKYPEKKLLIETSTDKPAYEQRSKINFRVYTSDEEGLAQGADLSMSVYRFDSLQSAEDNDISSYFLLTSDLKGTIESPSWYFDKPDKTKEEALDNLLLTQGWRRFRWADVLTGKTPSFTFAPEYLGHIITGQVVNTKTGMAEKKIQSYLSIPGTRTQFTVCTSDSNGNVKFEMPGMFGSSEIIVQTNTSTDSLFRVDITNPFSDQFAAANIPEFVPTPKYPATMLDQSISMQVQNIYAGDKLNHTVYPVTDTSSFYKSPTNVYLLDNYTRFATMEEVLREYVANMIVKKNNGVFYLPLFNISANEMFDQNPLILLDGVPVFDINKFMGYDPLKIKKLEVLNKRYFSGDSYFDGIMNFTTYKGDLSGFELDPHAVVMDYEGLQVQREFYAPVYENEQQLSSHVPDFRSLLYWSPGIITGKTGEQKITFYTSDLPGKYIAVLQGNTSTGTYASKSITFEVK